MHPFLYRVAQTFLNEYGDGIRSFSFVFPNRRAGLFFQRYLSVLTDKPLFSPEILTINECFTSVSHLQTADRLSNLFRLYRIFLQQGKTDETFDTFVFWGEMLLSDFDEVDKYRVDARQLFTNITELRELDRLFNVFSENQIEAIRSFWSNFVPVPEGKTQENFMATWKILYPVYEQFHAELIAEGLATDGLICREVTDRLVRREDPEEWEGKQFVFVGFNALNPCEKELMLQLQKRDMADFYWDYESPELREAENPASLFYAENIHVFPSKLNVPQEYIPFVQKEITLTAVPSTVGQTRRVFEILDKLYATGTADESWTKTAVVLPDEGLLMPLLHAIPQQIEKINVTMGYPLQVTPVAGFMEHLFELQRRKRDFQGGSRFYYQNILSLLHHQYISGWFAADVQRISQDIIRNNKIYIDGAELRCNALFNLLFAPCQQPSELPGYLLAILKSLQTFIHNHDGENSDNRLTSDIIYAYYSAINRMAGIFADQPERIDISFETLVRLVKQLTAGITIPFIGEPLNGLQVMGGLETRGIDFENLIITSFNEGIFPSKNPSNSFIPYNLRRAFGLPTYEHQDAILSYNFYRIISRAKKVFFIYDSRTEGIQTGEVSRYFQQLKYHYGLEIPQVNVDYDIAPNNKNLIEVQKTPGIMQKLQLYLSEGDDARALSASSINTYLDCPLRFYLTEVEKTGEPDEVTEMIEDSMFGTLFHATMQNIYRPYVGKVVHAEELKIIAADKFAISNYINRAFSDNYFKRKGEKVELEGNNLLIAKVLLKYVVQVLHVDAQYAPFRYTASEERCHISFPISEGNVNIKGFIDRIDEKDGVLRILDYKTGKGDLQFRNWDDVFDPAAKKRPKFVMQTFLYALMYKEKAEGKSLLPGVFYLRDIFKPGFDTTFHLKADKTDIEIDSFHEFENEFADRLTDRLSEIFDQNVPFKQTNGDTPCKYCQYNSICLKVTA